MPRSARIKRVVDFLERRLVEHALGDEIGDGAERDEDCASARRRAAATSFRASRRFRRCCPVDCLGKCLACGARDSGFAEVGNMTPEEMVSRLLYRDGLMLVIDKPAGMAVHRGRRTARTGTASRRGPFRRTALRTAAAAGAGAPARPRHLRLPGARPASQGAGGARQAVSQRRRRQDLLGRGRRRAGRRRRHDRTAARPARRHPRLVDEARSGGPAGA